MQHSQNLCTLSLVESQDDDLGMFYEGKQIEFSQKMLWEAKGKLQQFIHFIGSLQDQPCCLQKYQGDLNKLYVYQIGVSQLLNHMDNTIRKMLNNKKIKFNWNKDDLVILLWVIQKYNLKFKKEILNYTDEDWETISKMIPGKNGQQCMFKWLNLKINRKNQKYRWSPEQDQLLKKYASQNSYNYWFEISKKLYLKNQKQIYRTPKQCRERWGCYLNPEIKKGQWQPLQDYILITKYLEFGKKWSQIIKLLKGRTQNAVKNRYNLLLSKFERNPKNIESSSRTYFQNYIKELELLHHVSAEMVKKIQKNSGKPRFKSLKHIKFQQNYQSSIYISSQDLKPPLFKTDNLIPEMKQQELEQLQNPRDYQACLLEVNKDLQNKPFFQLDTGLYQNNEFNILTNLNDDDFFFENNDQEN